VRCVCERCPVSVRGVLVLGPSTRVLHELVEDLKRLPYLNTVSLKFNAFIFGLLK